MRSIKGLWITCVWPALCAAGAAGAEDTMRLYVDRVEPMQQVAYEKAVRDYNACLGAHGFRYSWRTWVHETGDTQSYSYTAGPYAWADFDKLGDTDKDCEATWRGEASPHLRSESSVFLVALPELSYAPRDAPATPALISVSGFTLKPTHVAEQAFLAAERKIAAAAQKSHWEGRYALYKTRGGGKEFPDYIVCVPYADWRAYGAGFNPSLWQMVETAYGTKTADALRRSLDDALVEVSIHIERYSPELSYVAANDR